MATGEFGPLLTDAKAAGLLVHAYTLRAEKPFLLEQDGRLLSVVDEARLMFEQGVDGVFIDQPTEGRLAVDLYRASLE